MANTMTVRGYARHRGCSHVAVLRALREGRIVAEPEGTIDADKADAAWTANTRPKHRSGLPTVAELSRALLEAKAARERLRLHVERRSVVSTKRVRSDAFAAFRATRDRFAGLGDRVAPMVVGLTSVREVAGILEVEIRAALNALAADLRAVGAERRARRLRRTQANGLASDAPPSPGATP